MSRAYYNEIDPKKAAWLRELIKAKVITDGEVDERPIQSVQPSDLRGFERCHFFAGIGAWDYALDLAGWTGPVWTGSCPCPSFSAAGKGEGFNDPRHLWPDWDRLIEKHGPPVIFGEQVDAAIGHGWLDLVQSDLEAKAYAVGKAVLGACSVGAPHRRQRLYFVADAEHDGHHRSAVRRSTWKGEEAGRVPEPEGRGAACGLAEPDHTERWPCAERRSDHLSAAPGWNEGASGTGECGAASGVDYTDSLYAEQFAGERAGSGETEGGRPCSELTGSSASGDMEHAAGGRCGVGGDAAQPGRCGHVDGSVFAGELGDTEPERFDGWWLRDNSTADGGGRDAGEWGAHRDSASASSPTRGFWANAEWIYCRDGKWRPIEPGSFPLVTGATARILRLRGYGDAICAPVAAEFVKAYMETISGASIR